jgi:uncharacterized protein YgbK (DUF1537 family)
MTGIRLAFYGDDFTGSTDPLEALSLNGVRTVLFLERPSPSDLDGFGDVEAVGLAGRSRTMSPTEMDEELPGAFETLAAFDPDLLQYKVCSTVDSSPETGSIGHAIDIGQDRFASPFVPMVVAAPSLGPRGRYVLFGNHFATYEGTTYRLDRHPTMSEHPVTPMTEADLRRHLGEQTDREIGLVDVRAIEGDADEGPRAALRSARADGEIVLFDGLNHDHQRTVGRMIWEACREVESGPLFSASSVGIDYALVRHWQATGAVSEPDPIDSPDPVDQIVVMSGSASPVTVAQIDWALDNGFEGIRLDTAALVDPEAAADEHERAIDAAIEALEAGSSPLLFSARGPDDSAIEETLKRLNELGIDRDRAEDLLGTEQGCITRRVLDAADVSRACVAGGDTSGYVAPKLDIYALEYAAPVGPGSPLCEATAHDPAYDGFEIALKGGQVETTHDAPDYFGVVRDG